MADSEFERLKQVTITLREREVVLDADLAAILGIETRLLNQHIRRHQDIFGDGQLFRITEEEIEGLRSQVEGLRSQAVISNSSRGGRRSLPMAFTIRGLQLLTDILPERLRHPWLKGFLERAQEAAARAALPVPPARPTAKAQNRPKGLTERQNAAKEAELEAFMALLASHSLRAYIEQAWPIIEPGTPFTPGWHIDAIAEHLEAVSRGEIRKLLINMPPRHMKSLAVSVFWPTWEWLTRPEIGWLFASYAMSLAVRDSVKCRRIIESPWYQQRWGHIYQLTGDQNVKSRYENTRSGYRLSLSVDSAVTGEGGDRIVCLEASMPIWTNQGPIPIGQIVEERLPVRVLGSSGRFQEIEAYERNPGRPLLEIVTTNGDRLVCTEEHPVFTDERGFIPALEVVDGDFQLRHLRPALRSRSWARGAEQDGTLLLPGMLRDLREQGSQSGMERGQCNASVPLLPKDLRGQAGGRPTQTLLLDGVRVEGLRGCPAQGVCHLRGGVRPAVLHRGAAVLLPALCEHCPPDGDSWRAERPVRERRLDDGLLSGLPEEPAAADSGPGRGQMRPLRGNGNPPGTSPGRFQDEPPFDESCDPLHPMPPHRPHEDRHQCRVDEPVRIVAVRRRPAPDYVYNLRVAPDHDYYAASILTHNCDDPHNVREAESDAVRSATIAWWKESLSTRINDPRTATKVVVMQRVHEEDLAGYLLAEEDGWEHLCLPAEYEPKTQIHVSKIGWQDPRTEPGELLWPQRFGPKEMADLKKTLGSYGVAGQLQQRPSPAGGGMLKRFWWRYWCHPGQNLPPVSVRLPEGGVVSIKAIPLPAKFNETIQSWDATFKDTKASDYVVGQIWARKGADKFILDQVRARLDFPATVAAVRGLTAAWPEARLKLVEDKANGPAVIATLKHEIAGIVPVSPQGSKEARAAAVSPDIEAGNVYLPHPAIAPWVDGFVEECAAFPASRNDDQVDAMTQALIRYSGSTMSAMARLEALGRL